MDEQSNICETITVKNELGLHARPASNFVATAFKFDSDIYITNIEGKETCIDAKSIMSVLSSEISKGTTITICAQGDDAQEAIDCLIELIKNLILEDE